MEKQLDEIIENTKKIEERLKKIIEIENELIMFWRGYDSSIISQYYSGHVSLPLQFFLDLSNITKKRRKVLEELMGRPFDES